MPRHPTRIEVAAALKGYDSFVGAIVALKDLYGSHDKLAIALGAKRQRTISWTKGKFPDEEYRAKLKEMGFPAHLLIPAASVEDVWRLQLRLESDLAGLRRLLETFGPEPA